MNAGKDAAERNGEETLLSINKYIHAWLPTRHPFMRHFFLTLILVAGANLLCAAPLLETSPVFPVAMNGVARYRIPGVVVTTKGTVLAYAEARRNGSADWGEIEVHLRRSLDGGRTWQPAQTIAHR